MSGWWKAAVGFAGAEENTAPPVVLRNNFEDLGADVLADGGQYLVGFITAIVENRLYYAAGNYEHGVDSPTIRVFDGRTDYVAVTIPERSSVPAEAILRMYASGGSIYISTVDAGSGPATWQSRVYKYTPATDTLTQLGTDATFNGYLVYALAVHDGKVWAGTTRQDPTQAGELWSISVSSPTSWARDETFSTGSISSPSTPSVAATRPQTNYVYQGAIFGSDDRIGVPISRSISNDAVLDSETYNTLSIAVGSSELSAFGGWANGFRLFRTTGGASQGAIGDISWPGTTDTQNLVDNGLSGGTAFPASPPQTLGTPLSSLTVGGSGATTYTYVVTLTHIATGEERGLDSPLSQTSLRTATSKPATLDSTNKATLTFPSTSAAYTRNVYRIAGHTSQGLIASGLDTSLTSFEDDGIAATSPYPLQPDPAFLTAAATKPSASFGYKVTAENANGETLPSLAGSTTNKPTLSATIYNTISWSAVTGATQYHVYRTVGGTTQGKIGTTASTSLQDTGLAASGSPPTEDGSGDSIGSVLSIVPFEDELYVGLMDEAGQAATVRKRDSGGTFTSSHTGVGGTMQDYNGFTAMALYLGKLYAAFWNPDTTPVCKIYSYNGTSWSEVADLTDAAAVPIMALVSDGSYLYALGGGLGTEGHLHRSADGTTWSDVTSSLPDTRELLPAWGAIRI